MNQQATCKVLLIHPDDDQTSLLPDRHWTLVVDLGRAPASTYDEWSRKAGCQVLSLFDLAEGTEDLHGTRVLLEYGMGEVVDRFGIDWWDVLAQSIVPQVQQLMLVRRLGQLVGFGADIFSTHPHFVATALHALTKGRLINLQPRQRFVRRAGDHARHYLDAVRKLDLRQVAQVLQDKFDPEHAIRRRFAVRRRRSPDPVILLPSAYVNVSRMAVSYAAMLPEFEFLLILARNSGRLQSLPANVKMESLDGYFADPSQAEVESLQDMWKRLRLRLVAAAEEFFIAEPAGLLGDCATRLKWGVAVRDAWNSVFESQSVTACLCADDSNPYSRLPLILAKSRGIPALACHHGALDSRMAIKRPHADFYLSKSEMERDYLSRVCHVASDWVVPGTPVSSDSPGAEPIAGEPAANWLVFFTEAYHASGWRTGEVYRELIPALHRLARNCGLELIFKLHPFDSEREYRRLLLRYLPPAQAREVRLISGPITAELWQRTKCVLTGQSSVALECSEHGIPVFLCAWLADPFAGYLQQFARFGIQILQCAQEIDEIPKWITLTKPRRTEQCNLSQTIDPETLRQHLVGTYSQTALMKA